MDALVAAMNAKEDSNFRLFSYVAGPGLLLPGAKQLLKPWKLSVWPSCRSLAILLFVL